MAPEIHGLDRLQRQSLRSRDLRLRFQVILHVREFVVRSRSALEKEERFQYPRSTSTAAAWYTGFILNRSNRNDSHHHHKEGQDQPLMLA